MARSGSGGRFRGFLEFIGVEPVREDPNEDLLRTQEPEPQGYGRGTTYDPRARGTSVVRASSTPRADTYVPSYTGSRPRARATGVERAQEGRTAAPRRERSTAQAPERAPSRTARAARFTEEGAAAARQAEAVRAAQPLRETRSQRMVMLSMQQLEDCCDVIDHLISGSMVLITLDDMDQRLNQRVIDTLSGSVYALRAKIRKASEKTYLVAPGNVDIDDNEYVTRGYGR